MEEESKELGAEAVAEEVEIEVEELEQEPESEAKKAEGESGHFRCKVENTSLLVTVLRVVVFPKKSRQQTAVVFVEENGIRVVTEMDKSMQAQAFCRKGIFSQFEVSSGFVPFCMDLTHFIDCLRVFGGDSQLELSMKDTATLVLELQDIGNSVITNCEIRTFELESPTDFGFRNSPTENSTSSKSIWFKDAFSEMDAMAEDSDVASLRLDEDFFTVTLKCDTHEFEAQWPLIADIFTLIQLKAARTYQYRVKLLRAALRSVKHAEYTRLHFNESGVLKMEQTYSSRGQNTWVAFYVNPIEGTL